MSSSFCNCAVARASFNFISKKMFVRCASPTGFPEGRLRSTLAVPDFQVKQNSPAAEARARMSEPYLQMGLHVS